MANRINNKRYNKLLSYRNNYFGDGGLKLPINVDPSQLGDASILSNVTPNLSGLNIKVKTPVIKPNLLGNIKTAFNDGKLDGVIQGAASAIGKGISGGLSSGVGNGITSVTNTVGKILPGKLGTMVSGIGSIVGGVANSVFGSKENTENVTALNSTINNLNNFKSDANSFDTLSNTWGTTSLGANFSDSYVGKDGLLSSKKMHNKAEDLRKQMAIANAFVTNSLQNNATNLTENTMNNLEAAYAAFGGELNTNGANFPTGLIHINEGGTHESNPYEGVPMGVAPDGKPNLVEEGEAIYNDYVFSNRLTVPKAIRSKYKLRGNKNLTFADAVKQLSKGAEERPNDPISQETLHEIMGDLTQAQEEKKAMEREHTNIKAFGGKVHKFDGNPWTPSAIKRYSGVANYYGYDKPTWMNNDGTYQTNYIDFINNSYTKDLFRQHLKDQFTYYDNADATQKQSSRYKAIDNFIKNNPNWYNNRGTIDTWNISDDIYNQGKTLALSNPGFMHPEDIAKVALAGNTTGSSSNTVTEPTKQNRYYLRGVDAKGNATVTPMSVTPWEGYNKEGRTFAELYPNYTFQGKQERPIENNTIYTDYYYDETKPTETSEKNIDLGTSDESLRYAPAVGLGVLTFTDALGLTNNPDYTEAAQIEAAAKRGSYLPVDWNPIGNKLTYRPFDRDYYINKLNASAGATRRALSNQSGGNSGRAIAGLLAADYNAQDKLGDLFRKSEEYNLEQRQKVEDFNRATNQANSQGMLQADMANQQAYNSARDFNLRGTMAAAEMRQKARMASEQAKSANLSGFLQALGDIGYENKGMNMIRRLAETSALGAISEGHPLYRYLTASKGKSKSKSSIKKDK